MLRLLRAGLALALSVAAANAADYFVSNSGNDANDCLSTATPCLTIASVVGRMPAIDPATMRWVVNTINLAPGNYPETVDVTHLSRVMLRGPLDSQLGCINASSVHVDGAWAEDGAVLWNACFTTGQIGCRQYAIVDSRAIVFDGTNPVAYTAIENCKINCSGQLWVTGPIWEFAVISGGSTFMQACDVNIAVQGLEMIYFFEGTKGIFDLAAGTYSGFPLASGMRFFTDSTDITFPAQGGALAIPGEHSTGVNPSANSSR